MMHVIMMITCFFFENYIFFCDFSCHHIFSTLKYICRKQCQAYYKFFPFILSNAFCPFCIANISFLIMPFVSFRHYKAFPSFLNIRQHAGGFAPVRWVRTLFVLPVEQLHLGFCMVRIVYHIKWTYDILKCITTQIILICCNF